ncbi:Mini-ribonuclease 3 [uncultured Eubacterium sp.]|uniref:Mini-ribonuclease 3 n=1 Tax=uncultured Eubacterium sp. TaxID=165185 RepID=UPI0015ADD0C2|nr:ribonuclease III domain-containing protein [uncultured Eubacterium sp.]
MRFTNMQAHPNELSPLNLAFIGDCVYEMLVRESLVLQANRPVNDLHRESVKYVSAKAQTVAYDKIKDILTEQETAVYKRGRNAKVGHNPKSASQGEYHIATGIEALFGYLYLSEQTERIKELFSVITQKDD